MWVGGPEHAARILYVDLGVAADALGSLKPTMHRSELTGGYGVSQLAPTLSPLLSWLSTSFILDILLLPHFMLSNNHMSPSLPAPFL